jgi:hypothetical protein
MPRLAKVLGIREGFTELREGGNADAKSEAPRLSALMNSVALSATILGSPRPNPHPERRPMGFPDHQTYG